MDGGLAGARRGQGRDRVLVIGAGMGGLAAAVDLARRGADVTVLERAASPGGKMRQVQAGGAGVDAGPTVFTMRWIFEGLFADAGERLEDALALLPAETLARHAWRQGGRLDLFADVARSAAAIGDFAGAADASGYLEFCRRSADIHRTLVGPFIAAERPSPIALVNRVGWGRLDALWRTRPWQSLWGALGQHFRDPRLRQLFGRYATYCGCSPFLAPATLMLVAHVEQDGVWLVDGGMVRVAEALQALAERQGARFRFGADVAEILVTGGRAAGVRLADGTEIAAEALVFNGDAAALARGMLGGATRGAGARHARRGAIALRRHLVRARPDLRLPAAAPQRLLRRGLRGGVRRDLPPARRCPTHRPSTSARRTAVRSLSRPARRSACCC
jgi:1-hydroxycarotenoid 3,4-desaturase